ncbi:MAG: M56 family metallopeptidase [Desulfitobacteriaceae bacterium]
MNLTEVFRYVVSLSLLGSVLVIGILLIKLLFRQKLSATWHYYIWFVLILRLLIPFTPPSPFSVLSLLPQYPPTIHLTQPFSQLHLSLGFSQPSVSPSTNPLGSNTITTEQASFGSGENTQSTFPPGERFGLNWTTAALVWLTGVLAILFYILVVNILLLLKSRKQRVCDDENVARILEECRLSLHVHSQVSVVYDDSLKSPALFGLFRPKIIISPEIIDKLSSEELRYVFLHELSHLKRRDLLVNTLVTLVQVIYWFNPLIWYALHQMKQDCEIACDASALATVKPEEHKRYGQTIISLLQLLSEPNWAPGTVGFASEFNKRRIVMISSFKRTTLKWTFAALALTLVVGWGTTTQAQPNSQQINISTQTRTSNNTPSPSKTIQTANMKSTPGTGSQQNNSTPSVQPSEQVTTVDMQAIGYSQAQLTQVQNTANKVGVKAFLPQTGTTGDQLTVVKNGGSSLVLDYKNIWIIESAQPINLPTLIDTDKKSEIPPSVMGQYITNNYRSQTNSFLYFQNGNTYISIQNLRPGNPITESQLSAIASSFEPAQS